MINFLAYYRKKGNNYYLSGDLYVNFHKRGLNYRFVQLVKVAFF